MLNDNLFSQSYNQILSGALGGGNARFQMLGTPQSWSWPIQPTGVLSAQAYQAASNIPDFSPVGTFNPLDADLFSAYRSVLSHIGFNVSPDVALQVRRLRDQVTSDENAATQAMTNLNQSYLAQKQNGGPIFAAKYPDVTTWLNGPGAQLFKSYDDANAIVARDSATLLTSQKAAMPSTLQDALDATTLPTGDPASASAPRGWTKVPDGSGILQWQPDYTIGTTGQDFRAELASGTVGQFTVSLDASDTSVDYSKSWAGGTAEVSEPFWSVNLGGSWSQMDLTQSDQSVTAEINVKSSTLVPVTPGAWYDSGFLRNLAQGGQTGGGWNVVAPWTVSNDGSSTAPALFGRAGLLPARVAGLLAIYQPSFSITMSQSTFQQNQARFEASAGIRIGPFTFGGEGGHESNFEHSSSGGTTFSGGSTSTDPVLVGVTVAFPGLDD